VASDSLLIDSIEDGLLLIREVPIPFAREMFPKIPFPLRGATGRQDLFSDDFSGDRAAVGLLSEGGNCFEVEGRSDDDEPAVLKPAGSSSGLALGNEPLVT
jgi:hypothetical protein